MGRLVFGVCGFLCSWQRVEKGAIISMWSSRWSKALFRLVLGTLGSRMLSPKDQSYGGKLSQRHEDVGQDEHLSVACKSQGDGLQMVLCEEFRLF